ncbi:MAG: glycine--tRNA ligase subunit beta [Bryobacteraceae bacterium]|nr:glycine--tRNA ligase subunit beta [Bryobacteraceae bacterium]
MKTHRFLLEIGTEEIPDWMIPPALEQLRGLFEQLLNSNSLSGTVICVDATPRRLVVQAQGLPERQPDSEETLTGPPKAAGDTAAAGFARKLGVPLTDLVTVETPKGEYFAYRKRIEGRPTVEILARELPGLIWNISWPKTMYWRRERERFIRPIRWVVALLDSRVVPFEVAGVASGNVTSGHRQLGRKRIRVTAANYEERLRANYVLVRAAERERKIREETEALLAVRGLHLRRDDALLQTLVYLTEYPTPLVGEFDRAYLDLPHEVLVTVMRHHQKYLSVEDAEGRLAPYFVAVMNMAGDPEGLVKAGNERVLRARFNDARFFWQTDQKKKLADRLHDLAQVTFQTDLGSYLDKTQRVVELVKKLGGNEYAQRAALLAKCDLTTEMVKEFTELQGVIGGLYAREQGEPEPVWRAIYEHYKPESMEDAIPSTPEGRLVSLADKLDTLQGCFRLGMIPSGSKDPFALRRAAQGVVKILVEGKLSLPVTELAGDLPELREFFLDRVRYYFREVRGFRYDEVNAVLAAGWDDLTDVESRLEAIRAVRPTANFEPLAASFKRIRNILRQAEYTGGAPVEPGLLEPGPETELYEAFDGLRSEVEARRREKQYRAALERIASLRPRVDLFFDKVLVNAPDERIRRNRLALLDGLLKEFSTIADFSEIVTEATNS